VFRYVLFRFVIKEIDNELFIYLLNEADKEIVFFLTKNETDKEMIFIFRLSVFECKFRISFCFMVNETVEEMISSFIY
jgi:hypothetical protein